VICPRRFSAGSAPQAKGKNSISSPDQDDARIEKDAPGSRRAVHIRWWEWVEEANFRFRKLEHDPKKRWEPVFLPKGHCSKVMLKRKGLAKTQFLKALVI